MNPVSSQRLRKFGLAPQSRQGLHLERNFTFRQRVAIWTQTIAETRAKLRNAAAPFDEGVGERPIMHTQTADKQMLGRHHGIAESGGIIRRRLQHTLRGGTLCHRFDCAAVSRRRNFGDCAGVAEIEDTLNLRIRRSGHALHCRAHNCPDRAALPWAPIPIKIRAAADQLLGERYRAEMDVPHGFDQHRHAEWRVIDRKADLDQYVYCMPAVIPSRRAEEVARLARIGGPTALDTVPVDRRDYAPMLYAYALAGMPTEAAAVLDRMLREVPDTMQRRQKKVEFAYARAAVALARNDIPAALRWADSSRTRGDGTSAYCPEGRFCVPGSTTRGSSPTRCSKFSIATST